MGREKKAWAITYAQDRLNELGLTVFANNTDAIAARIEAAILRGVQERPPKVTVIEETEVDLGEVHDGAPPAPLMAQTMAAVKAAKPEPEPDCRYRRDGLCNCPEGECFADEVGIENSDA